MDEEKKEIQEAHIEEVTEEINNEEEIIETAEEKKDKKIKNLISAVILLAHVLALLILALFMTANQNKKT